MTTFTFVDQTYVDDSVAAGVAGIPVRDTATFSATGTLATFTGATRFYPENACTIAGVRVSVGTAPTGLALICDVNKNGTTVFTTQSNRPTVLAGTNTALSGAPTVTSLAQGDFLTVDLDQIGSTIAGSDLTVQVYLTPTA